jgi:hypothetical protein
MAGRLRIEKIFQTANELARRAVNKLEYRTRSQAMIQFQRGCGAVCCDTVPIHEVFNRTPPRKGEKSSRTMVNTVWGFLSAGAPPAPNLYANGDSRDPAISSTERGHPTS